MTPERLAAAVRERARRAGFEAVGIASARVLDRDAHRLAAWLRRDYHAGMAWMAREPEVRTDPRLLLPGCRSVIVVARNYGPAAPSDGGARVAAYAQGRDYHRVLGRPLRELAAWLSELSGETARAFVDTGPVLERGWAEAAGIGWIGKNANLLNRDLGSWVLLGEILSAAELAPDPGPHPDHCGSCTACIEACPTDAIVEPGTVDSDLCISYWTIEHRGPIPRDRRKGIGEWIFGCDECQTSCPWNETFGRPTEADPFRRRSDLDGLDPRKLLALDEATFRARYSGTALMRAKWEGMRRNACIVLGNRQDREAVPDLAALLRQDEDPVLRGHAAWALGRIESAEAVRALERALDSETEPSVRREIEFALRSLGA